MLQNQELLQKIKQLEEDLKQAKSCKRYWLVWEDKKEIFEEEAKNALPILKENKDLEIKILNSPCSTTVSLPPHLRGTEGEVVNLIIEWDNYHSLSALNYTHSWKIDVIYIDPPYNTWNKDFIYNDSFVDKEDSYRHSKWLSFMNKRLKLAKNLLSEKWVIFISIDDNEFAQLKILCDDIFWENNLIWVIKWRRTENQSNIAKNISTITEYIFVYWKDKNNVSFNKIWLSEKAIKEYRYSDKIWKFRRNILLDKKKWKYIYEIKTKNWITLNWPWMKKEEEFKELVERGLIYWSETWDWTPYLKNYLENSKWAVITDFWDTDKWSNQQSSLELERILSDNNAFSFPKHTKLIKNILKISSSKNSIILDFFAWSWTTGQAVMELNKEDWWNRQFILCSNRENTKENPDKNICKNITYERNKRIIEGYTNNKWEKVQGLWWNLKYYKTEFIKIQKSTDDLRYSFINMCDDLLCIKENTFEKIVIPLAPLKQGGIEKENLLKAPILGVGGNKDHDEEENLNFLKFYKSSQKITAILYDIHHFVDLIEILKNLDWNIFVYIFSLSKDIYEEEISYLNKNITIQNIPDDILETYKKIFEM